MTLRLKALSLASLVSASAVACGGGNNAPDAQVTPDATVDAMVDARPTFACDDADMVGSLTEVPGIVSVSPSSCDGVDALACFNLEFEQAVEPGNPGAGTFAQRLQLIHRGCDRPTVIADWGYEIFPSFYESELSDGLANAINVEHRYQGTSRPTTWSWTALTIENGAHDQHQLISTLRGLYQGRWISTGASKGGITALYHHYFHPTDLDGVVAYVAPASRARVDNAYQDFLASTLTSTCATNLRQHTIDAVTTRRTALTSLYEAEFGGGADVYLEYDAIYLEWGFWQYAGESYCAGVPPLNASDSVVFEFLRSQGGVFREAPSGNRPGPAEPSGDMALAYEWLTEQGFADQINASVRTALVYPPYEWESTFVQTHPDVTLPPYDGSVTSSLRTWLATDARDVVLIYGGNDPWTGGRVEVNADASNGSYTAPGATHGAGLSNLGLGDREAALTRITAMLGVAPARLGADTARAAATAQAQAATRRLLGEHARRRAAGALLP